MTRGNLLLLVLLIQLLLKECRADCERNDDAVEVGRKCRKPCTSDSNCKGLKRCECDGACGLTCFNKNVGCNDTEAPANGYVKYYGENWGRKAYYYCNEGFVRIGVRYSTCYADKKWSPNGATCEAGCATPTDVDNSYPLAGGSAQLGGKKHTFACNTGYYLTGNPNRTCHPSNMTWSKADFSCHIQQCGAIEEVTNGVIHYSKGYNFTSFATLQCEEGYEVVGSQRMRKKCEASRSGSKLGRWTGSLPSCSIISCPELTSIENGYILHAEFVRFTYSSIITFKCNDNYKIKGNAEVLCNADRNWSTLPECVDDLDCNFNSVSSQTCHYANVKNAWRRIPTREWNGFNGFALKSSKANSVLRSSNLKPASTESFVCLKFHYKLTENGEPDMLRIKNSSNTEIVYWENHANEKINEWLDSSSQIDIRFGLKFYFFTRKPNVLLDDIIVESGRCVDNCQDGRCENGGTCVNRAHSYTCFCTREFYGLNCEFDRRCPSLPSSVKNGYFDSPNHRAMPDTRATFRCNDGYKVSNKQGITTLATVTCRSNDEAERSRWSDDPNSLRCEEITCDAPAIGTNQRVNKNKLFWVVGEEVEYRCIEGFEFFNGKTTEDTAITRQCLKSGRWSESVQPCYRPMCTFPKSLSAPQGIPYQTRYSAGKSILVKCPRVGEELTGDAIVTCVGKEKLSHDVRCKKITCRIPYVFYGANNDRSSRTYGETYTYQCLSGRYMVGNPTVTCGIDGKFSQPPTCKSIGYCSIPKTPIRGKTSGNQKNVEFSCEKMYTILGSSSAVCDRSTKRWSHDIPKCVEKVPHARMVYKNIEYLIFMEESLLSSHLDAHLLCNSIGGNLAILYSEAVRRELEKILKKTPTYQLRIALRRSRVMRARHDQFDWDLELSNLSFSRSRLNDRHWDYEYPNIQDDCVAIQSNSRQTSFGWRNVRCDDPKPFVCQRNKKTCRPNPCKNNGECTVANANTRSSEECGCKLHFYGDRCENEVTCDTSTLPTKFKAVEAKREYSVGSKVFVDCKDGKAVGNRWIACAENGRWSGEEPRCEGAYVECGALRETLGANMYTIDKVSQYLPGRHYRLRCDSGYRLIGDYSAYCNWDGQWAKTTTRCDRMVCPEPDLPENVVIIQGHQPYVLKSRIMLGCSIGERVGENVVTCQPNGNWAANGMFSCVATTTTTRPTTTTPTTVATTKMPDCGEPNLPRDAYIVAPKPESYLAETRITLQCTTGRQINGSSSWICKNGAWSFESKTSCIVNVCILDTYLLMEGVEVKGYTNQQVYNTKFNVNDQVTLTCEDSTKRVEHYKTPSTEPTIRCKLKGLWSEDPGDFDCDIDDCSPDPCKNGATCVDGINNFACNCVTGYEGQQCSENIDECIPNPCQHSGFCHDRVNEFVCECRSGYDGKTCEIDIDDCSPDPCKNGATCVDGINDFTCNCVPGYEGKRCNEDIDDCASGPCLNDGLCSDELNDFLCECVPGYDGKTCEKKIDECDSNPCLHGGTCGDQINGFVCECAPGYRGKTCETSTNDCQPDPCQNGAICIDGFNDFTCSCPPGHTGKTCDIVLDYCDPNPCRHVERCETLTGDFFCICINGYEGKKCENEIDECRSDPCKNDGTCRDHLAGYSCSCEPGYTGENCETNVDNCGSNPCNPEFTTQCKDGVNDFSCECKKGYTGKTCVDDINECDDNPCQNGGICENYDGSFICECSPMYTGNLCEQTQKDTEFCPLPVFEDGITYTPAQNSYTTWSKINLHCETGRALVGEPVAICKPGGAWQNTNSHCKHITCIINGENLGEGIEVQADNLQFVISDSVQLSCSDGKIPYVKNEEYIKPVITCQQNQQWSTNPESFECKYVCSKPPTIENVEWLNVREWYGVGETVWYHCSAGYLHTGATAEAHCQFGGQWGDLSNLCIRTSCPVQTLDMVFLLDGSASVGVKNFKIVKTWVKNISSTFDMERFTKLGVVQYSYWYSYKTLNNQPQIKTEIPLGQITSEKIFEEAVDNISLFGSKTYTAQAINKTIYDFESSPRFRDGRTSKVLLLLTDGESNNDFEVLRQSAEYVRSLGIKTYAVGVANYKREELQVIANGQIGNNDHVFDVNRFEDLQNLVDEIRSDITGELPVSSDCTILTSSLRGGVKIANMEEGMEKVQFPLHSSVTLYCPGSQQPLVGETSYVLPIITCQKKRQLSVDPGNFVCRNTCQSPATIENGIWNEQHHLRLFYKVNENLWFTCNDDYERVGSNSAATCLPNGRWSDATCRPIKK